MKSAVQVFAALLTLILGTLLALCAFARKS
jgi:hypothetical protein